MQNITFTSPGLFDLSYPRSFAGGSAGPPTCSRQPLRQTSVGRIPGVSWTWNHSLFDKQGYITQTAILWSIHNVLFHTNYVTNTPGLNILYYVLHIGISLECTSQASLVTPLPTAGLVTCLFPAMPGYIPLDTMT